MDKRVAGIVALSVVAVMWWLTRPGPRPVEGVRTNIEDRPQRDIRTDSLAEALRNFRAMANG